jgi:3-hydroxyisobutyrate dehydrogenase
MADIGIIGLGNMGRGMAMSLTRNGFSVIGHDALAHVRTMRAGEGIVVMPDIAALCREAPVILLSLPKASDVEAVITGPAGILAKGKVGTLVIDTTTSDPVVTRRMAERLNAAGMRLIDAPVSGGPRGALNGTMTMVIGGEEADIARAMPLLKAMSQKRFHVGPVGAGHVTKLVNNLLCAAHLLTAAEAMRISEGAGLDVARVMEGINGGSGRSAITEVNLPTWVLNGAMNSGFTMKLMRKDVALAAAMIEAFGLKLPMAKEAARLWAKSATGLADEADFNAITAHPLPPVRRRRARASR